MKEYKNISMSGLCDNIDNLQKGISGLQEVAQVLQSEITKKASSDELGRVLIGTGIDVDVQGRISLGKHSHDDLYYTKSIIDNKLSDLSGKFTIDDFKPILGDSYRDYYDPNTKYYDGDIYYKTDTTSVSFAISDKPSNTIAFFIPTIANPSLTKEMTAEDKGNNSNPIFNRSEETSSINKFFRIYGGVEKEFNVVNNGDNHVVGFAIEDSTRVIRTNSTVMFDINTINYTVCIEIPNTNTFTLNKTLTTEQDNPSVAISKTQIDLPIHSHDTQRDPILRKVNY